MVENKESAQENEGSISDVLTILTIPKLDKLLDKELDELQNRMKQMLIYGLFVGILAGFISSLMIKVMESSGLEGMEWLALLFIVLMTFASFVIVPFLPQYRKWLKVQLYNEIYEEIRRTIHDGEKKN